MSGTGPWSKINITMFSVLFADLILPKLRQQIINVLRISALNYFVSNCYELLDSAPV